MDKRNVNRRGFLMGAAAAAGTAYFTGGLGSHPAWAAQAAAGARKQIMVAGVKLTTARSGSPLTSSAASRFMNGKWPTSMIESAAVANSAAARAGSSRGSNPLMNRTPPDGRRRSLRISAV